MMRGLALVAATLPLAACSSGAAPDRAGVERIVHDYILAHPEIVPQALERLQQKRAAQVIADNRRAIETPFAGAWAGSPHPRVVLTMFTDYNCGYCRASVPDVARLIADMPDLKVVWREIPVLGPPSEVAAKAALAAAKDGRYAPFHQALFKAGRPDPATIATVARQVGLDPTRVADEGSGADVAREIDGNLKLAGAIGIAGTPAFVVGDRLLSGAVGYQALKDAIGEAKSRS